MHRCLHILEIVEMICSEFEQPPRNVHPLASFARVCKDFEGPALDVLWKNQTTVMNVVRCLPADLFDTVDLPHWGRRRVSMQLRRPVLVADWERPLFYARRVKRFTFHLVLGSDVPENIFEVLNLCLPGDHLFPNLEALYWFSATINFPFIRLFLSPRITDIAILCLSRSHLSILSTLGCKYPALKHVSISFGVDIMESQAVMADGILSISAFVRGLEGIESLGLHILDQETLECVGHFPTLKSLQLQGLPTITSTPIPIPDSPMFPSLLECDLEGVEIGPSTRFLEMFSSSPLHSLSVEFTSCAPAAAIEGFYAAVATACPHSILRCLELTHGMDMPETGREAYMVSGKALRALFCFASLRVISIASPVGFDLDDVAMRQIARAWPKIEILHLITAFPSTPLTKTRSTLQCLLSFAQYCPNLRTLNLTLDASIVPPLGTTSLSQEALTSWNVGYSAISSSRFVSRFISALFPNLRYVDPSNDAEISSRNRWKEVKELVPLFAEGREER
ncbi:hypothetical protein C8J57DRAFT_1395394 [Mycena rebaudengoi]|nr:hypothetical protein C8J57DRAFT_1395394 [Mycena rebaudengoi]